jgi:hypothetical protein
MEEEKLHRSEDKKQKEGTWSWLILDYEEEYMF